MSVPPAIAVMLDALAPEALMELERALRLQLHPRHSKAEQRVALLGFLAQLLAQPAGDTTRSTGRISRQRYEQERPQSAPQAQRLVECFGSWRRACRVAKGLLPDGRWTGQANPWVQPARGRPRAKPYTRDEVRTALRACALDLGRRPTGPDYARWREEKLKHAHRVEGRFTLRLPTQPSIYRLYPTGENRWRLALIDAAITDRELADAAARRHTAALELEKQARAEAEDARRRGAQREQEPTGLLNGHEIKRRRAARGVPERSLRDALGLALGPYRRLVNGKDEATLFQAEVLADLLGCAVGAVLQTS